MKNIFKTIKQINALALGSFLLVLFAWVLPVQCGSPNSTLAGIGALLGGLSLIWIKIRKEKGFNIAFCAIIFGIIGMMYLLVLC